MTLPIYNYICMLLLFSAAPAAFAESDGPWWDDYPLFYQGIEVPQALAYNADIIMDNAYAGPGWGPYNLVVRGGAGNVVSAHAEGLKSISYYETFGTTDIYVAEIGTFNGNATPILATHWDWEYYAGGTIAWVGALNWFDDQEFARPYTRTHPVYGGHPMRYPDGTEATGYNGDASNPLNHRVYDAGASKNILGGFAWKEDFRPNSAQVQDNGPHDGLILHDGLYYGHLGPGKDSACPWWFELDYATVRYAAEKGLDGMWSDNYGAWNSFSYRVVDEGFGEWSVALFRDYLSAHFTPGALSAMGVTDANTFDIRTYLRNKLAAAGGDDTDIDAPGWAADGWLDDPLWRAYKIYKRQKGTEALSMYSATVKRAALDAGTPEFLVAGNDVPMLTLGWPRGDLDMVSAEYVVGSHIDTGYPGMLLPPEGRQASRYKLMREHARSRFVNVWLQIAKQEEFAPFANNTGLLTVMFYEMLATHVTPHPQVPVLLEVSENEQAYTDFHAFVQSVKGTYADRVPVEEIGIYYSSSTILAFQTPGGFVNVVDQQHQFGVYGWGLALDKLHHQYRIVPEWKLNATTLAGLRVFIIPHAEVFDPADLVPLQDWVEAGGLLIVTGNSGRRLGESGNFDVNPAGLSLAPLTGVSAMLPAPSEVLRNVGAGKVLYLPDNFAIDYYRDILRSASRLTDFSDALGQLFAGQADPLIIAAAVPDTVGFTLYRDEKAKRQFLDINNTDIDVATDTVTPTGALTFDMALHGWLDVPDVRITGFSPDGTPTASMVIPGDGRANLSVSSVTHYVSLMFDYPDADGDGLSDGLEALLGTEENDNDSDGDGVSDFDEVWHDGDGGYDPYDPYSNPGGTDLDANLGDTDDDGVSDGDELAWGSDPIDPDDIIQLAASSPTAQLAALLAILLCGTYLIRRDRLRRPSRSNGASVHRGDWGHEMGIQDKRPDPTVTPRSWISRIEGMRSARMPSVCGGADPARRSKPACPKRSRGP